MKQGVCKLCGQCRFLVDAHIIPQSFFDFMRQGDPRPSRIYAGGEHPKRTRTGIHDEELVCADCEGVLSVLDDYGAKILIPEFPESMCIKTPDGVPLFFQLPSYNYGVLKLFLLSVLWRMSATKRPEFSCISLGPHEIRLAEMIKMNAPGSPDEYPVILSRFTDPVGHYSILKPRRTRITTGHTFSFFFLGGYIVRVKVDRRPVPTEINPFMLCPDAPLTIVLDDSRNYTEFAAIPLLVFEAEQIRGKPVHGKDKSTSKART